MAKYSMKKGGKEVGSASVYAKPHTMSGKQVNADLKYKTGAQMLDESNPSAGMVSKGNYKPIKTDGIETRGNGAATKGRIARGPMA
jgi:hypothetical protein